MKRRPSGGSVASTGLSLESAVSSFGQAAKTKLTAIAAKGNPEDQLRTPFEQFIGDLAELCRLNRYKLTLVGESSIADLKIRPDFAVSYWDKLVGFIEVKAPGKGADPRKFKDPHDREQWKKLSAIPNLIYTDGNSFSLWRSGKLVGEIRRLDGDIETAGARLAPRPGLLGLFDDFFSWAPIAPMAPSQLAETSARLCRLLRDEVTEQLQQGNQMLTGLATDWRKALFPDATDSQFADGYAQAVTFGLLLARARGISLDEGVDVAARALSKTYSLIGSALRILTDAVVATQTLPTSVATLSRVLAVVDWPTISKGDPDAWLYFYEDFLAEYDNTLRRQTGSYYTPVAVVKTMARLVNEALHDRFELSDGLANPSVTLVDPAVGTGTFLLEVIRSIAATVADDQGEGAIPGAVQAAVERLIGFELQLGPFAVAQLRVLAELVELGLPALDPSRLRMYVTNTLDNPFAEEQSLGTWYDPIAQSRREANHIKRDEPVLVVLGNPLV
jgi:N-6 DNA Methylase